MKPTIAQNAGFDSFRDYRWRQLHRFSYTPEDCRTFHAAIEEVVVPAAQRIYERRRARLGVDSLRPWDLVVDPLGLPPLKPFEVEVATGDDAAAAAQDASEDLALE